MTNFDQATKSFTLHAEGTQSYAWAWDNLDHAQVLSDITEDGNDVIAYAHGWACQLCNSCVDQINPEGERGFSVEEITNDLIDDRHALASAIQAWLEGNDQEGDDEPEDEPEDDQEPEPTAPTIPTAREMAEQGLLLCTSSLGGRGITPAGSIYIFSSYEDFIDQNPGWHWVQLPEPRWHGVTIIDDIDLPVQGGYQAEWGGNPTRSNDGYTYYPY